MRYGCACSSTTYNKNILFKEPYPNKYFEYGDEIGDKEAKYNYT